jgi:hypothetical protein
LEHVVDQLANLGLEIVKAETQPPDPAHVPEMAFIHGDNVIYAKKPVGKSQHRAPHGNLRKSKLH